MSKPTFAERCLLAEQCLPDAPYRAMLTQLHAEMLAALSEQPAQLPFGVGGGLVAIKMLLSRDPCVHANTAIQMIDAILAEQPAQQKPVAWKLVPTEPTEEMLKAMDNCSKEGYDERLYAGHAASVYMAAVDAAPTPPAQRTWVGLTDEETKLLWHKARLCIGPRWMVFKRLVEAAHGIKENT